MKSNINTRIHYSVIVLLEDESEGFADFLTTLDRIFSSKGEPYEIIVMANGTEGFLNRELQKMGKGSLDIRAFSLTRKTPQAVCLKAGFHESSGEIIVICGSYQQISEDSFRSVLSALDEDTDIISPWRQSRVDPAFNQFQSKIFNILTKKITGFNINDLSCTVRVFRRKVLEETKLYGNMYRFLPILAARKGFRNKEVVCEHLQECGKTGFYGLSEYLDRGLDIFTLYFNTRFSKKPLRFFSIIGSFFFVLGLMVFFYVFGQKIFLGSQIGGRPVLLLAILFIVLGVQAASVGFLGEIIAFTQGRHQKEYSIERII